MLPDHELDTRLALVRASVAEDRAHSDLLAARARDARRKAKDLRRRLADQRVGTDDTTP